MQPCGDGSFDVKGKIGIAVKRLEIRGFKTKGSIFECCFWPFFFLLVETYRIKALNILVRERDIIIADFEEIRDTAFSTEGLNAEVEVPFCDSTVKADKNFAVLLMFYRKRSMISYTNHTYEVE